MFAVSHVSLLLTTHKTVCVYMWTNNRLLDENGKLRKDAEATAAMDDRDLVTQWYETAARLGAMDQIFYDAQRQGRMR